MTGAELVILGAAYATVGTMATLAHREVEG